MSNTLNNLSRREFLSGSALAVSAAGMSRSPAVSGRLSREGSSAPQGARAVIERKLGRTGLQVPIVSMGVMNADNPEVVKRSYEIGVRLFDTALGYMGGRNEEMIGQVIKNLGVRANVLIQTKIPYPGARMRMGTPDPEETRKKFLSDFEGCLKRLQTDYVDLLLIHQPSVSQMNDPGIMQALTEVKKQGRARFSGVSTHASQAEVLNEASRTQFYDSVTAAFNFTHANDAAILEALRNAAGEGIGIIAMKTQAAGRRFPGAGAVNQTAALKWVLHHSEVTTAIPGYTNFDHMNQDFSVAFGIVYNEEEKKFLAEKNLRASVPFCQQCGKCRPLCPKGVDIPALMRCHMYAASYGNLLQARITLDDIEEQAHLRKCASCEVCTARCAEHLSIAKNIEDLRATYL
jgi:predicted aldo/keto reductase-like oxidoreductase